MEIKKNQINVRSSFQFCLETADITTKFPCFFSVIIKCANQKVQTQQLPKQIGKFININQILTISPQLVYNLQTNTYQSLITTIIIQIRSQKKPNQKLIIGVLNIDITVISQDPQLTKSRKYILEKSPHKQSFINFSIKPMINKQIDRPIDQSSKSLNQSYSKKNLSSTSLLNNLDPLYKKLEIKQSQSIIRQKKDMKHNVTAIKPGITDQNFTFKAVQSQYWTQNKQRKNIQYEQEFKEISKNLFPNVLPIQKQRKKKQSIQMNNNDLEVTFSMNQQNNFKNKILYSLNNISKNQGGNFESEYSQNSNKNILLDKKYVQGNQGCLDCIQKSRKIRTVCKQFSIRQKEFREIINKLQYAFKWMVSNYEDRENKLLDLQRKRIEDELKLKKSRLQIQRLQQLKKQKDGQINKLVLELLKQKLNEVALKQKENEIDNLKKMNSEYSRQKGQKIQIMKQLKQMIKQKQYQLAQIKTHSILTSQKQHAQTQTEFQQFYQPKTQQMAKLQRSCFQLNYKLNQYVQYQQNLKQRIEEQLQYIQILQFKNQQLNNQNNQLLHQLLIYQKKNLRQEVLAQINQKQTPSSKKQNYQSKKYNKSFTLPSFIHNISAYYADTQQTQKINTLQQSMMMLMARNKKLLDKIKQLNQQKNKLIQKVSQLSPEFQKPQQNNIQITQYSKIDQLLQFVDSQYPNQSSNHI